MKGKPRKAPAVAALASLFGALAVFAYNGATDYGREPLIKEPCRRDGPPCNEFGFMGPITVEQSLLAIVPLVLLLCAMGFAIVAWRRRSE